MLSLHPQTSAGESQIYYSACSCSPLLAVLAVSYRERLWPDSSCWPKPVTNFTVKEGAGGRMSREIFVPCSAGQQQPSLRALLSHLSSPLVQGTSALMIRVSKRNRQLAVSLKLCGQCLGSFLTSRVLLARALGFWSCEEEVGQAGTETKQGYGNWSMCRHTLVHTYLESRTVLQGNHTWNSSCWRAAAPSPSS